MPQPDTLDDCFRALAKFEKALQRNDLASALDWMGAAYGGLVRYAEDEGLVPPNRRPRRLHVQPRKLES